MLPTLSFPWDTSLTSLTLALLDPIPLRNLVEVWLKGGMHEHHSTDYVSGEPVGPWYAANDTAIVRCAWRYVCVTGDFAWLDKKISDRTVLDHLDEHAVYWEKLDHLGRGLADYGTIENLLEVVSTYLHEVAGMNAGNVRSMRVVADLHERRGNAARAKQLRAEATDWRSGSIACFTSMAKDIGVAASRMEHSTKFGTAMTFSRSSTIWRKISRRRRNRK